MLAKRAWLLFLLAVVAFYFYGLGHPPFIGPDEPRYAEVAREMFMRGDAVTPTLGGFTWFEKPALPYWIMMLSFDAFGVSEWAARFGTACAGLLTALIIYWTGRHIERASETKEARGPSAGSSLAIVSSAGLIGFSRGVNFDIILTLALTAALSCFLVSELKAGEKLRLKLLAGFYGMVGVSLLAKGLVGLVIPCGVIIAYFALRREWPDRVVRRSALWGIPLTLAVSAIWYVPVVARHGWPFVDQFVIQHHFARFVSNKYHHPQPFYFYFFIMAMLVFPWTAFLARSLYGAARDWDWRAPTVEAKYRVFAFAWLVVPVIFFSFSRSKLPGYILPSLPGAALLIGTHLARALRNESGSRTIRATAILLLLLAVVELVYALHSGFIPWTCALVVAAPLAAAGVFALLWSRLRRACVALTVCAIFAAGALGIDCAVDRVASRESTRDLLRLADARGYSAAPVFHMHTIDYTTVYYAAGRLAYGPDGEPIRYEGAFQVADAARQHGGPILVFIHSDFDYQLTEYKKIETEVIGDNGVVALIAVRAR
jgi:4-amino-4-deoxy-L-arabinose transferase-like glycosyltransferase